MGLDMTIHRIDGNNKVEVAYWRKANAIHQWFVMNLADGDDDCSPIPLSKESCENLCYICERVQKNPKLAHKLLPTTEGFFFGGTDYDNWYFSKVNYAVDVLEEILKDWEKNPEVEYVYQASW